MTEEILKAADTRVEPARPLRVIHVEDFESAAPLSDGERDACRRRFTTLFADEARTRRGGLGRVTYVTNALGECYACKTLVVPERTTDEDAAACDRRDELLRIAFRKEYECHRTLSGFKGFPRLYGYGFVDGAPAIIMEWVEGMTLAQARHALAVDDDGRLSPLTAAQIGRGLFELLTRMDLAGDGFVHRDISPSNIMVRTGHLSLERQSDEGEFDLCLIDFGSSSMVQPADPTFTERFSTARRATPAYAPPEMLSDDIAHVERLRTSAAVDVYAAASVVYELLAGEAPYAQALHGAEDGEHPVASAYRVKVDTVPAQPVCAHHSGADMKSVLVREPEVAVAAYQATIDTPLLPESEGLRLCLELVDDQLAEMVMACLVTSQDKRPEARAMRDGLAAFCRHYAQNVQRAVAGDPLIPCMMGASWLDSASPFTVRRVVRSMGKAVAAAIWCAVALTTAFLLRGTSATLRFDTMVWAGELGWLQVLAALALPPAVALAARGRDRCTREGFLRGTLGLIVGAVFIMGLLVCTAVDPAARGRGMVAALFTASAAGWCPIVLDYAMAVVPAILHERRRRLAASSERRAAAFGGVQAGQVGELQSAPAVSNNEEQ